ncbi:MAG: VWA domain-containing protein [Planctomycetaceae bacterium]|nr:VWA domain-containing protein [Planctomycetaceae bacterium]
MKNALRDLPAWGISLVINLTILFALSLIVQKVEQAARMAAIDSFMEEELLEEEYQLQETVMDQVGNMGDTDSFTPTQQVATVSGEVNEVKLERKIETTLIPKALAMVTLPPTEQLRSELTDKVEVNGGSSEHVQGGVDGVMDRVTLELRRSLEEGPTLALWLFDASGSLNERRDAISQRFETVYKQLAKLEATEGVHTVVASYGKSAALITPEPIDGGDVAKAVEAVKKIQVDNSGTENVFTALRLCVDKYKMYNPGSGRTNKLVFIVTDERGDDFQNLEEVINLCKLYHFRVFCIGNGSVFGQQKGYVRWKYDDGFEEDIAVDQGPETAFAQVLQLPFIGAPDDWRTRNRMSSGFGPYTLTRLCSETGGIYLLTEEARGDRFDPSVMRNYAPDYRPIRVIDTEIRKNPAMTALVQAASMTYEDGGIPVPETTFRGYNDNILREDLKEAQKPVAVIAYNLDRLQQVLDAGSKGRDSMTNARWRASYDLAMGRILAMRVRLEGYKRMCGNMSITPKTFENADNNMWKLAPADEIESGPQIRKAAEDAKTYLKRVIDEHPGTPWAFMAEKELSTKLGWTWKEERRVVPGMEGKNLTDEERVRLLLAEDEKQESTRRQQASKPRDKPKL